MLLRRLDLPIPTSTHYMCSRPIQHFVCEAFTMPGSSAQLRLKSVNFIGMAVLFGVSCYFIYWGLGYIQHHHSALFVLAALFGIFMAFNIGGNDVANSFGTSVGAGTLSIPQALAVAAVFEVSGAMLAGGGVTDTIRNGIVDLGGMALEPVQFVYIMMAALAAASLWLLFASQKGLPVSTTHSIIGGIVGAALVLGFYNSGLAGLNMVRWEKIGEIAISWVLSPLLGGVTSYLVFKNIKTYILGYNVASSRHVQRLRKQKLAYKKEHKTRFEQMSELQQMAYTATIVRDAQLYNEGNYRPEELASDYYRGLHEIDCRKDEINAFRALRLWVPLAGAVGGMVMAAMLLFKGLKHLNLGLSTLDNLLIVGMVGAVLWMGTFAYARTLKTGANLDRATFIMFSWLQVFTACCFAFSHGSNDIANAVGPFAAIVDVLRTEEINAEAAVPGALMLACGIGLVCGLWFIGRNVINTVGTGLTEMHPASGFTAELAAAGVVMAASMLALPVSSTHILIGAVLGVGIVNRAANWGLMKPIALAWVITLPAAALIGALGVTALRAVFGS